MTVSKLGKFNSISFKVSNDSLGQTQRILNSISASLSLILFLVLYCFFFVGVLPFLLSWLHSGTSPTLLLMPQMNFSGEEQPQQFWGWVEGTGTEAGTVVPLLPTTLLFFPWSMWIFLEFWHASAFVFPSRLQAW